MEIKIGVQWAPRELEIETQLSRDEVQQALNTAIEDGGLFVLHDVRGGTVMVPADKVAYLDLGSEQPRRVGFGA